MTRPAPANDSLAPDVTERELSGHIFAVSAGLIGVCLTVIGLFRLVGRSRALRSWADDFIAMDAGAFLVSCLLAYLSLRSREARRRHRLERMADAIFLLGLTAMVVIGALVAYELV